MTAPTETDVLVLGSGMGGLSAALFAAKAGYRVTLCEKAVQLGGTTATSGGMIWIPGSRQAQTVGINDSPEKARTYLESELGNFIRHDLVDAFLEDCRPALDALESDTDLAFDLIASPDYHPDQPGGLPRGRSLVSKSFDGRLLGDDFALVRPPNKHLMALGGMMVAYGDVISFLKPFSSITAMRTVLRRTLRYAMDRFRYSRGTELSHGNALVARFLVSLRKSKVEIRTRSTLVSLVRDGDAVSGAIIEESGRRLQIKARHGVVLATGGFAASADLRAKLSGEKPHDHTLMVPENVGEGLEAAQSIGAVLDDHMAGAGFWTPASAIRDSGTVVTVPYGYTDRAKPGIIAVNLAGKRFVNEANSYHDVVMAMFSDSGQKPCYFICDTRFAKRYGFGLIKPWPFNLSLSKFERKGYIVSGKTLEELAHKTGIDSEGLKETVSRNNDFAATGIDSDFNRGSNAYNSVWSDATHRPNGNLGVIESGPFWAMRIAPATLGTALGLKTDGHARVLDKSGQQISGLYAVGCDQGSVMRGFYPAGGITLAPALVFAYRAVKAMGHRRV